MKKENCKQVEARIFDTLNTLANGGLDHEKLEASMANLEFQMRERDYGSYPQGLILGMQVLDSWLYGGSPEANLQIGDLFVHLREKMKQGYFEHLIRLKQQEKHAVQKKQRELKMSLQCGVIRQEKRLLQNRKD